MIDHPIVVDTFGDSSFIDATIWTFMDHLCAILLDSLQPTRA